MKLAWAAVGASVVMGVACASQPGGSGTGPGSSGGGNEATVSGFGQDYCNLLEPCCEVAGLGTTGAVCEAFVQGAAGGSVYDPISGQACVAGMQAESAAGTFCTLLGNDVEACGKVFTSPGGLTAPGAPCTQDSDCAKASGGGATCYAAFSFEDGGSSETETCVQTTPGQAGEGPCIGVVSGAETTYSWTGTGPVPTQGTTCAVADGLTCSSTTQKCTTLAGPGAPCFSNPDCVAADYCAETGSSEVCAQRLADGASCLTAPDGCEATSYCEATGSTCQPSLATGAPCTSDEQCSSDTCVNQVCSASNDLGLTLLCGP